MYSPVDRWMEGWLDGQTDRWTDGLMDRLIGGWVGRWVRMGGTSKGWMDRQTQRCLGAGRWRIRTWQGWRAAVFLDALLLSGEGRVWDGEGGCRPPCSLEAWGRQSRSFVTHWRWPGGCWCPNPTSRQCPRPWSGRPVGPTGEKTDRHHAGLGSPPVGYAPRRSAARWRAQTSR